MSAETIQSILDEIDGLPKDEQQRLYQELTERLAPTMSEEEFAESLAKMGKVSRPARQAAALSDQPHEPVPISGEPLSETIIRERR